MKVLYGRQALAVLAKGMRELSRLVATTYGPYGSRVLVSKKGKLLVTLDGASLAHELRFPGLERLGVALSRTASSIVDGNQGDGTSTTLILASALVDAALDRYSTRTWDPVGIVRDICRWLPAVEEAVLGMSQQPDEQILRRVASMASHGDDLVTDAVVAAVLRVGENGTVLISPGEGTGIETEYRDGLVLDVGWAAHSMGKGDGVPRVFEGPLVVVVDAPLQTFDDVQGLMAEASQWPGRGLILFCPKLGGEALTTLVLNDAKGVLPCVAVTYLHPSPDKTHDWLEDVATVTNATVVGHGRGDNVREFKSEWLGSARKVTVSRDRTEILSYPEAEARIETRVGDLILQSETATSDHDRDRYRERAAMLDGGLGILKVGGYTASEAQERRSRVEDTLHAVREALKSGVVPGAGRALHHVSTMPELQETEGGRVLARALEEPLRVLCSRAGVSFGALAVPGDDPWVGWCPVRKALVDFSTQPFVVDPVGVVLGSLRAAVSVACEVILTEVVLIRSPR